MKFTGERFLPEVHGSIELEHLHRYLQACEVTAGKCVLDIASGEGYGSAMLAKQANKVIGVDISLDAVRHARERYTKENLEFMVGSCADIPLPDSSVDVVVSFETIEHHDQHEQMMQEIKRVLRPAGILLISSPDKYHYSIEPGYSNEFHVKELYQHEFKHLLGEYFKNIAYFCQRVVYGSGIFAEELTTATCDFWKEGEIFTQKPGLAKPIYWIALASDDELPELPTGLFETPIDESENVQSWRSEVTIRDGQIANLTQSVAERDGQIGGLHQAVAERDGQIGSLSQAVAERDGQIGGLHQAVAERDGQIGSLNQAVAERDGQIAGLHQAVAERDGQIASLHQAVDERDGQVADLHQAVAERDGQIASLSQAVAERDGQVGSISQAVAEREEQISDLKSKMTAVDGEIAFWNFVLRRLKAPLRLGKRFLESAIHPVKAYRLSRDIRTLKSSSLFDINYYLCTYRDVRINTCNPIRHYCETGWKEGRNPSSSFNTNDYLANNPDIAALRINPLVHYIKFGKLEGRYPVSVYTQKPSSRVVDSVETTSPYAILNLTTESQAIASATQPDLCRRAELMLQSGDGVRRILVIDSAVPTPDMDSGSVRMFGILRIIKGLGFSVTFAADRLENDTKYVAALNSLEINILQGYTEIRTHLQTLGNGYSVVIISRPEIGERYLSVVRAYAAQAELDYDTVDLHYLRFKRGAELTEDPELVAKAEQYLQLEMLCCTSADRVFAITETEKKAILQNWPNTQVQVIPNVHSIRVSPQPWLAREGIVFIGGYDHQPNVDAVVWFVQEILPIITKHIPGIKFTILGSKPPENVLSLSSDNVTVVGWVPDPEPYFDAARVFVAPLRYGAGMKGKVGQAMSLGLPVVTTHIGAEGMGLVDNVHALIEDTPEAFAAAVVRLYNDEELWERMQRDAAAQIDNNFSESAVESILLEIWAGSAASQDSALGATA